VAADFADLIEANSAALASHLGAGRKCGPQAACLTIDFSAPVPNADAIDREHAWTRSRNGMAVVDAPRAAIAERIVRSNCEDLASFALLEGQQDEWLAPQAGIPLHPALFGRDTLTAGWQSAWMDSGASLHASLIRLGRLQGSTEVPARDEHPVASSTRRTGPRRIVSTSRVRTRLARRRPRRGPGRGIPRRSGAAPSSNAHP